MRSFPPGYYTGESTSWCKSDVVLTEVRHAVGKSVAEHQHEAPYFSLLLEGAYEERGDGFDLRYEPYTLVFHAARTPHEDRMLGPCRFFAVDLLPKWEAVIAELGGERAHVFELAGGDPIWLVLRLYREFLARADAGDAGRSACLRTLRARCPARRRRIARARVALDRRRRGPRALRSTARLDFAGIEHRRAPDPPVPNLSAVSRAHDLRCDDGSARAVRSAQA